VLNFVQFFPGKLCTITIILTTAVCAD